MADLESEIEALESKKLAMEAEHRRLYDELEDEEVRDTTQAKSSVCGEPAIRFAAMATVAPEGADVQVEDRGDGS